MGDRQDFNVKNASHKQIQYFFQKNLTRNAFLGIIKYVGLDVVGLNNVKPNIQRNYRIFFEEKFDTNTTNVV